MRLFGWLVDYCEYLPLKLGLLRISHSVEALESHLISTVALTHTKPLF